MGMLKRATGAVVAAVAAAGYGVAARAADLLGQPTPNAIDMQPSAAPLRDQQMFMHNVILFPITTAIAVFVLILLLWCAIRFNSKANPVPAKFSHNTPVEIIWTVVPVLILMFIAIFSFKLLYAFHDMPPPDVTVKATGNQWYWTYEYPDEKIAEYTSNILPEDKTTPALYRLAVDNPVVVPLNKVVRILTTGADVIHSWTIPAFGIKMDAIPGRTNETWFKATKLGTYYGQCSELCGLDHAFMPIEVRVVTEPEFEAWVASKGGSMPGAVPASSAATVASGSSAPAASGAPTASSAPAASAAPAASSAPAAH
jgi:cytochrome c oxidase subunit 2